MAKLTTTGLAKAIVKQMQLYSDEVNEKVKQAVDDVSKTMLAETKATAPDKRGRGSYKRAMKVRRLEETMRVRKKIWYVETPLYRIAHVLEKGHAARDGSRVKAYPHIQPAADKANREFERRVKEAIGE